MPITHIEKAAAAALMAFCARFYGFQSNRHFHGLDGIADASGILSMRMEHLRRGMMEPSKP